jgi:hypothetical protein
MTATLAELGARYCAWESTDRNDFQRRTRMLQSIWREEKGLSMGEHRGRPLGFRLTMPWAETSLANFLTDTIRTVVREEVIGAPKDEASYSASRASSATSYPASRCASTFMMERGALSLELVVFAPDLPEDREELLDGHLRSSEDGAQRSPVEGFMEGNGDRRPAWTPEPDMAPALARDLVAESA